MLLLFLGLFVVGIAGWGADTRDPSYRLWPSHSDAPPSSGTTAGPR